MQNKKYKIKQIVEGMILEKKIDIRKGRRWDNKGSENQSEKRWKTERELEQASKCMRMNKGRGRKITAERKQMNATNIEINGMAAAELHKRE